MNDINNLIQLLILDIDGVLTDGTKIYDKKHTVISKLFQDKDFTAIKRFKASGVNVITISGDIWNQGMAKKRNLDFYHSRSKEGELDKSIFLEVTSSIVGLPFIFFIISSIALGSIVTGSTPG